MWLIFGKRFYRDSFPVTWKLWLIIYQRILGVVDFLK